MNKTIKDFFTTEELTEMNLLVAALAQSDVSLDYMQEVLASTPRINIWAMIGLAKGRGLSELVGKLIIINGLKKTGLIDDFKESVRQGYSMEFLQDLTFFEKNNLKLDLKLNKLFLPAEHEFTPFEKAMIQALDESIINALPKAENSFGLVLTHKKGTE